ncbi:MAG: outer-membrane lipoprotein carrier protein LolA [Mariprofundales bacterium]
MMHKSTRMILLITALILMVVPASATPLPPLLQQGLKTLNQMSGFSAHFIQTITYQNGEKNRYEGSISLLRPGKFRWQYTKPYAQLYIGDSATVWHYEPDLLQAVQLTNLDSVDPVALQLLDGRIGIDDVELIANDSLKRGQFIIRVRHHIELTLELDGDGKLIALTHLDTLGNRNRIVLSAVDPTPPQEQQFHFIPPAGVDIVHQGE